MDENLPVAMIIGIRLCEGPTVHAAADFTPAEQHGPPPPGHALALIIESAFTGSIATAAQAHALATFPFKVVFEYNYPTRAVPYFQPQWITFSEGRVYTKDRPGLRVEVNTESLRLVETFTEANNRPMYYRPDGSPMTW